MEHRLLANFREQIPQREIDARDRIQHDAFAPVIERGEIHLVPHLLDVGHTLPFEKPRQMFLHYKCANLTARGHRKADRPVARFNFNDKGTEHIDTERLTALPILGVTRHWGGDMVVDPVIGAPVMITGTTAANGDRTNGPHGAHGTDLSPY